MKTLDPTYPEFKRLLSVCSETAEEANRGGDKRPFIQAMIDFNVFVGENSDADTREHVEFWQERLAQLS